MTNESPFDELQEAAAIVRQRAPQVPQVAVVLGSGLGGFVDALTDPVAIEYADVPGMPSSAVKGHAGRLVFGALDGTPVVAMQGRVHLYEGHSAAHVVFGARLMVHLGARSLIVTNASGGIADGLAPGDLVCIRDHINLTGTSCLTGPNDERLGPRFPDMSGAYDGSLRRHAHAAAAGLNIKLTEGVYGGVHGPTYETPAEVRMLRTLGADLVGMSTVQEVIAAHHMGARVLGLSCVTNAAAGLDGGERLDHADVQRRAAAAAAGLCELIRAVVSRIVAEG